MGQHRIKAVDMSVTDEKETKPKGKKKQTTPVEGASDDATEAKVKPAKKKTRSKKYQSARGQVDRTKTYPLAEAVSLVKKTSYAKFNGTIIADLILRDQKVSVKVSFPHSTGKTRRVVIATDALLKNIAAGKLDFDVLIAKPEMMAAIAKHARVLGPKGLMPNPKDGTVTADPEKKKAELEGGATTIKTEKKAPLMHVIIGKTAQKEDELVANAKALIDAIGGKRLVKLVLSATMSPGIKVDLAEFQTS